MICTHCFCGYEALHLVILNDVSAFVFLQGDEATDTMENSFIHDTGVGLYISPLKGECIQSMLLNASNAVASGT
ncbi:hypothetical protein F2Q69_00028275 [Brassica cretica]|uniref:Uncharacterized protein n=1 Tax=Brassica cretica TaxID=69181 RepID=A0A8S9RX13_BRACR|nr:hypothetical protein F2Q69_00028275 [Brassica cretica]